MSVLLDCAGSFAAQRAGKALDWQPVQADTHLHAQTDLFMAEAETASGPQDRTTIFRIALCQWCMSILQNKIINFEPINL